MPNGLTLNPSTGEISGIPTTQGFYMITIRATRGEQKAQKDFSISIYNDSNTTIINDNSTTNNDNSTIINNDNSTTIINDNTTNNDNSITNNNNTTENDNKSLFGGVSASGGCDSGLGIFALGLAVFVLLRFKNFAGFLAK